jgi:hypothetical protein
MNLKCSQLVDALDSTGKVKVFKIFSDCEEYKVLINYKKKKICENYLSNNSNSDSIPSLIFQKRFNENIIEKNFFPQDYQHLLKKYMNNYFNIFSTTYSKEEELLINSNIETKEFKELKIKYDLNI